MGCRLFDQEPVCVVSMEDFDIPSQNQRNYLKRSSGEAFRAGIQRWFDENRLNPQNQIYIDNIITTLELDCL